MLDEYKCEFISFFFMMRKFIVGKKLCVVSQCLVRVLTVCIISKRKTEEKNERQSRYTPQTINRLNASLCLLLLEFSEANLLVINYIFTPVPTNNCEFCVSVTFFYKVSHLWLYTIFYALFIVWHWIISTDSFKCREKIYEYCIQIVGEDKRCP